MDSDIPARDHTVNGSKCLTEDDVRAYLPQRATRPRRRR
jgi:hypothetical protein